MAERIQHRRATTAEWAADDEILAPGQIGIEFLVDGKTHIRVGDGVRHWSELDNKIGPQGIQGIQGVPGEQGIQGIQGVSGANGEKWSSSAGPPLDNQAGTAIGDFHLNLSSGAGGGDIYERTSNGAGQWTFRGNIKGPQGIQGVQGNQGIQGVPGAAAVVDTFKAWRTSPTQSIPHSTWTALLFDTETLGDDVVGFHSAVLADQSKFTAPYAGILDMVVQVGWAASATGTRYLRIVKGTNVDNPPDASILSNPSIQVNAAVIPRHQSILIGHRMVAGDVVSVGVHQTSGGALNVLGGEDSTYARGKFIRT